MNLRVLAVMGLAALVPFVWAAPASAGTNMHVEVAVVVVGTAPPGTTFTVHFVCTGGGPSGDLVFDAVGNPTPAFSNFFNDGILNSTCTITETVTGGASSVAYQCQDDGVNASCAPAGNQVTFDSPTNTSNNVDFTVTNTFVAAAAPAPVTAAPAFTG